MGDSNDRNEMDLIKGKNILLKNMIEINKQHKT